jgi:autotransporter-associated beta strand protein
VLAFDRSNTFTYTGAISGSGEIIQMGTGTLVLDGTNTVTGQTIVSSGTLVVGDAAHPGASLSSQIGGVYVQKGATLEGYGTIGTNVYNSGTVMPGDGPGSLTVSGYSQSSTGTLEINIAQGNVGLLRVTGAANLAGTLDVNFGSGIGAGEYTFLTASSVTGQFANVVTTGVADDAVAVQYAPTSASLIVVPVSGAQLSGAFTRNTLDIAETLDDAIFAHLDNQGCREPGDPNSKGLPNCPELSIWRQIFGGAGAIDGTSDLSAVASRWAGFAGGVDVHTDMGFWLGLSGSYERNELGLAGDNGQVGINVFSMTVTGGLPLLWGLLDGMASFHMNDGDSKRIVSISGSTANAEANPKDDLWDVAVQYEHGILADCLSGFARFTYTGLNQGSYSEAGAAPFDFQIDSKTFSTGYADVGLHYDDVYTLRSGTMLIPEASAGVRAMLGDTQPDLQAQIANAVTTSTIAVPELDRDRVAFKADLGVTAQKHGLSYYLRLDGLMSGNQREGAIMIGAASSF